MLESDIKKYSNLVSIPHFQLLNILCVGNHTVIYRMHDELHHRNVIVKALKTSHPSSRDIAQLKHEYEIIRYLHSHLKTDCIIKAYGLEKIGNSYAIILEDFNESSLHDVFESNTLELSTILHIIIEIAETLGIIHQLNVIHKDINPSNILFNNATNSIKIIDFGISTQLSSEFAQFNSISSLEGTITFLSPEQTGRMNRSIDYRTDYYSLGATLYFLLTGHPPFYSEDRMEIIHSHIAKIPIPPCEFNHAIPSIISDMTLKLLNKNPEDRYQSSYGLIHDLKEFIKQSASKEQIISFPLATKDFSAQFQLPEKLYGRDKEISYLLKTFQKVVSGKSCFLLVSGYSGVGKSSLIHEIHKPIASQHGYFISGKCNQYHNNTPYASLILAFNELIEYILGESQEQINKWRNILKKCLLQNGKIITDVIPQLKLIIGEQNEVPELNFTEAQNRFNFTFKNFIQAFAQPQHPLTIFLDDLQWVDPSSLKLLTMILSQDVSHHLFLIGAYRSNEVDDAHILMLSLKELEQSGFGCDKIELEPLKKNLIEKLLNDAFHANKTELEDLAELCYSKTDGNPFFLRQLLGSLHKDGLIIYNPDSGQWSWDIDSIKNKAVSENVIELMTAKINEIPRNTQELLKIAACMGNRFDLEKLAKVSQKSILEAAQELWSTLEIGLVIPDTQNYKFITNELDNPVSYHFLHDKVQQAIYASISENQRRQFHYKIGLTLLGNEAIPNLGNAVFHIVSHLNENLQGLTADEIRKLTELNYHAGKKAKASTAFKNALIYFESAKNLLPPGSWEDQYLLTFSIFKEYAELLHIVGRIEEAEKIMIELKQKAQTELERAEIGIMQMSLYSIIGKMEQALDISLEVAKMLGLKLSKHPSLISVFSEFLATKWNLGFREIAGLVKMPEIEDQKIKKSLQVLQTMVPSVYLMGNTNLLALISFKQVNIALCYGNSIGVAYSYATYGLILCAKFQNFKQGFKFGQLALNLVEKLNDMQTKCKVYFLYGVAIHGWIKPWNTLIPYFKEAIEAGLISGDLLNRAWSCCEMILWDTEHSIDWLLDEGDKYLALIKQTKYQDPWDATKFCLISRKNLAMPTKNPLLLSDHEFDEGASLARMENEQSATGMAIYHFFKTILLYYYDDYINSLMHLEKLDLIMNALASLYYEAEISFYACLIHSGLYPGKTAQGRNESLTRMRAELKKMKCWAKSAPENYLHFQLLMEAEIAKIAGHHQKAEIYYQQGIEAAKKHKHLRFEALANELTFRFYWNINREKLALSYFEETIYLYKMWGAGEKIRLLEEKYPQLCNQSHVVRELKSLSSFDKTEEIDISSYLISLQKISGEIHEEELLKKIMQFVTDFLNCDRCLLLFEEKAQIYAAACSTKEEIKIGNTPLAEHYSLPIIQKVIEDKTIRIIEDVSTDMNLINEPHLKKEKISSILCYPLINLGVLEAVLYMELSNSLQTLQKNRINSFEFLCPQIAIAIQNMRNYAELEKKVNKRKEELIATHNLLIQKEKIALLGTMTVGIAQEIEKDLHTIVIDSENVNQNVEELSLDLHRDQDLVKQCSELAESTESLKHFSEIIVSHGKKAHQIVERMIELEEVVAEENQQIPLSPILMECIETTREQNRKKFPHSRVAVNISLDSELNSLSIKPNEIRKVMNHILDNAFYWMRKKQELQVDFKPELSISTKELSNSYEIRIKDNGLGISVENQNKVFTPFFTTRPAGEGVGFGLSLCYHIIVDEHKGSIKFQSEEGSFTEFVINLPKR